MTSKLNEEIIQTFLKENPSWKVKNKKLHKTFTFKSFIHAFGFMSQIAIIAERDKHHPEWFNVYNRVVVDLVTHEFDGITERDFELARAMDKLTCR